MSIPEQLVSSLQTGRCLLFLGRETSAYARHPKDIRFPSEADLARMVANKFLDDGFARRGLGEIVELAALETDLGTVQTFVAEILNPFLPGDVHNLVPTFYWQAIASTVLDLTVERAYSSSAGPLQRCVPFTRDGQRLESRLKDTDDLMYLKLNGCITEALSIASPLVLAADQYASHQQSRSRLFERVQEFALEFPIIAIGSSLSDPDLRMLLQLVSRLPDARPTSYVVAAQYSPADERLWSSRRFVAVKMAFDEFMQGLDRIVPRDRRRLARLFTNDHPILRRSIVPGRPTLSPELRRHLEHDADYLYPEYKTKSCNPRDFYKGYLEDWAPIAQQLDVKRHLSEQILLDAFLPSEAERLERQELFVVKGHAGSGKTALLRRVTWDAAMSFDKLCLYVRGHTVPEFEILREIFALTNQRVFVIIDDIEDRANAVEKLLTVCERKDVPVTIIGGIRSNVWNARKEQLEPLSSQTYELEYLTNIEIEHLVSLLTTHRSLGHLEGLNKQEQIAALAGWAGRQLLVALHEATLGLPFADIVFDEYQKINSAPARSLYLTVCVLHSLGLPVRAGLISRVHRIPFSQFERELFAPLDSVVHARPSRMYKDYEYVTRHQHIAEMVVERALVEGQARFDEYARIVGCLDIDYETDREALHGLMNAKHLRQSFPQEQFVRDLFALTEKRFPESAGIAQQHGIFEMSLPTPAFDKADALLHRALELEPRSRIISHSLAELALKRADHASTAHERTRHRVEARRLLTANIEADPQGAAYSYHSKIKILLDEMIELGDDGNDISFQEKTKEIEKIIATGLGKFPESPHLLEAQSRFYSYLKERPRALTSLRAAYEQNKRSTYLALSLAKLYDERGEPDSGTKVLKEAIEGSPNDKELHFALAKKLLLTGGRDADIQYHLHRSFINGDARYDAQFTYARFLYERGDIQQAGQIFARLRHANLPESTKRQPRHWLIDGTKRRRFSGVVASLDSSFGFVIRDQFQDRVFCRSKDSRRLAWSSLRPQTRVTFEIAFNYLGPVATDMILESAKGNIPGPPQDDSASARGVPDSGRIGEEARPVPHLPVPERVTAADATDVMSAVKVFISYSHDSERHRDRVLALSERLRKDGVETILDGYLPKQSPTEGWPRWMLNSLDAATDVVCVCTETYYRRFRGHETPGVGKGVNWEGSMITQELYESRRQANRFIPVVFERTDERHIPEPLRGQTRYVLDTEASYRALYDALLDQAGVEPGPVGELKRKLRTTVEPLSFDDAASRSDSALSPATSSGGDSKSPTRDW